MCFDCDILKHREATVQVEFKKLLVVHIYSVSLFHREVKFGT